MIDFTLMSTNLIINSILSFWMAALIISISLKIVPLGINRGKLTILLLPLVVLVWDCLQGIPSNSILSLGYEKAQWIFAHKMDPGINLGGAIATWLGPTFAVNFILYLETPAGNYSMSYVDFILLFMDRREIFILLLVGSLFIICISCVRILRRAFHYYRFSQQTGSLPNPTHVVLTQKIGPPRKIPIFQSNDQSMIPFAGGIIKPFIHIPKWLDSVLTSQEQNAVLQHELAHIKHRDLILFYALQFLTDLFWFIPGISRWNKKILCFIEQLADQTAIRSGVEPTDLASAMIKLKQHHLNSNQVFGMSVSPNTMFQQRINLLLQPPQLSSWFASTCWGKIGIGFFWFWTCLGLQANFLGNHDLTPPFQMPVMTLIYQLFI